MGFYDLHLAKIGVRWKEDMPKRKKKYWSAKVTKESFALDLEEGVFTFNDPRRIAHSLKHSAIAIFIEKLLR